MDGIEVTKQIREVFGDDAIVIIVSAYDISEVERIGKDAGGQACFKVEKAELWSAENPVLYDLEILSEGERIFEKVGIRTIEIRDRKYLFNGQPIKFRGVNRHDFHSEKGAAVSLSDIEEDLRL